jgi:DHA1 family multidrug resistance protein-like MFS transporter
MADIIREASFGQIIRWATSNRVLKYPEEEENFECPKCYRDPDPVSSDSSNEEGSSNVDSSGPLNDINLEKADNRDTTTPQTQFDPGSGYGFGMLENRETSTSGTCENDETKPGHGDDGMRAALTRTRTREMTRPYTQERFDIEREEELQRKQSMPIIAQRNEGGDILVDWYTTDDPANPQNWSSKKKVFVGLQIL